MPSMSWRVENPALSWGIGEERIAMESFLRGGSGGFPLAAWGNRLVRTFLRIYEDWFERSKFKFVSESNRQMTLADFSEYLWGNQTVRIMSWFIDSKFKLSFSPKDSSRIIFWVITCMDRNPTIARIAGLSTHARRQGYLITSVLHRPFLFWLDYNSPWHFFWCSKRFQILSFTFRFYKRRNLSYLLTEEKREESEIKGTQEWIHHEWFVESARVCNGTLENDFVTVIWSLRV